MNKVKFIEMCKKYDYEHNIACIILSLYYNYINQPIVNNFDHTHLLNNDKSVNLLDTLTLSNVKRHLSWTDKPFEQKRFRDLLDVIVGFKSTEDIPDDKEVKKDNVIGKLREDIASGKIIRVPTVGGFTWRRVK